MCGVECRVLTGLCVVIAQPTSYPLLLLATTAATDAHTPATAIITPVLPRCLVLPITLLPTITATDMGIAIVLYVNVIFLRLLLLVLLLLVLGTASGGGAMLLHSRK